MLMGDCEPLNLISHVAVRVKLASLLSSNNSDECETTLLRATLQLLSPPQAINSTYQNSGFTIILIDSKAHERRIIQMKFQVARGTDIQSNTTE